MDGGGMNDKPGHIPFFRHPEFSWSLIYLVKDDSRPNFSRHVKKNVYRLHSTCIMSRNWVSKLCCETLYLCTESTTNESMSVMRGARLFFLSETMQEKL